MPSNTSRRLVRFGDNSEKIIATLSSETTRRLYKILHNNPQTPVKLADELSLTVQTIHYHLDKLQNINLVNKIDTEYSNKGIEMGVYEAIGVKLIYPDTEKHTQSTATN